MKQVLESDLSNPNSVANRLSDSRYQAFARAFNFSTTGSIKSSASLQTNAQQNDLRSRLGGDPSTTNELMDELGSVKSVADFESNGNLYNQVLQAYGIDPDPQKTFKWEVTAALESDLSNPLSAANRPENAAFRAMAEDFNFGADGTIGAQKLLQSEQSTAATTTAYTKKQPTDAKSQQAAADETGYYTKTMPMLTSVTQIVSNPRLVAYIKTAFGLDPNMAASQLGGVLTSNLADPKSLANTFNVDPNKPSTSPTPYQLVAQAFSIGTDGAVYDHSEVTPSTRLSGIISNYTAAITASTAGLTPSDTTKATDAGAVETAYFQAQIEAVTSVDSLLSDTRMVAYLRTAFNLPAPPATPSSSSTTSSASTPPSYSLADLRNILTSDLTVPTGAANTSGAGAQKLATAFHFLPNGLVYTQRPVQSSANVTSVTTIYQGLSGTSASSKAAAQSETDYYNSIIPRVRSVDDLLGNKRLVAYLTKAFNLPSTQTSILKQVLTSDLSDPKSAANKLGASFASLAAAFDFDSSGRAVAEPNRQVQTKSQSTATKTAYLNQAMELEAGNQYGDGVRLALYFKRVAPTISSAYGILADQAMTKVIQTTLGLSSSSSKADIDSQARFISSKINIADFQDPAKLDKLVARFTALYDIQNNTNTSPILQLFKTQG